MPGVAHVDFTDSPVIDPFWSFMLNGDNKLKRNGNDVYLVNTAIWMRFVSKMDAKL